MRFYAALILLCLLNISLCLSQNKDTTAVLSESPSGTIKATVQIDRKMVPQNRTVTFTVKISWQGDLDRYEIEKLENPVLTNLEIMGNSSSNWVGEMAGVKQAIKTYEFILKPLELGMAYIDGLFIEYKDQEYDETNRLVTNRLEIKIIDPLKEKSLQPWILGGGLFFLVVILSFGGFSFIKHKKAKEAELKAKAMEMIPIEDKYLSEFKQKIDLQNSNMVESLSSLSKLFREYLSERYHIPAMEITTHEIGNELNKLAVSEKVIEQTEEVLRSCDVAKFSGGHVERGVLERTYTLVEDILNRNKSDDIEFSNQDEGVQNDKVTSQ
ncbi:MAG: hypothetical protein ACE5HX_17475 [bacterium]